MPTGSITDAVAMRDEPRELSLLEVIGLATTDPRVDPDKLRQLLDIRERVERREAEIEFHSAMNRVQIRAPRVSKKGKIVVPAREKQGGGMTKPHATPYALYEDIDTAIRPIYQEEGFSVSFSSEPVTVPAGHAIWHMILSHRMGHSERYSSPALPPDVGGSKNKLQEIFSSSSYAHRYLLCLVFNVVTVGADDDARATSYLNDEQIGKITDLLNACEITPGTPAWKKFLWLADADAIEHIQQVSFDRVLVALRDRESKARK